MKATPIIQKIFGLSLVALILLNWLILESVLFGVLVGLIYLIFFGLLLGEKLFKSENFAFKLFWGCFLLDSILIFSGSLLYFISDLAYPKPFILISLLSLFLLFYKSNEITVHLNFKKPDEKTLLLFVLFVIGSLLLFDALFDSQTTEAVRGPWNVVSSQYVLLYGITTLVWLFLLLKSHMPSISIISTVIHFVTTTGVALIVFPLGYGFDSFLHRAAENIILLEGVILPKTPYYIGQYSLLINQHYLTLIPIELLDTLLLPMSFALFFPILFYLTVSKRFNHRVASLSLPLLLLVPVSNFIQTTPQGMGNLFILFSILWFLISKSNPTTVTIGVQVFLALTAFVIHPLSGIALFLWLGIVFSLNLLQNNIFLAGKKRFVWGATVLGSILVFPALFLISSWLGSPLHAMLRLPNILDISLTNIFFLDIFDFTRQFNTYFDFVYLYRFTWILLILILGFIGLFINNKKKYIPNSLFIGFSVLFLNSIFVKLFITFDSLIFYEQADFTERIYGIALLFLLPFVAVSLITFCSKIRSSIYSITITVIILSAVIMSSMYISYPRFDSYELVRTFNTSEHDIEAVKAIERDANGADYVVLSNQAVSAAAVQEFGFKKYYGNTFFYPIPTGGSLYQHYLAIVESGQSARDESMKAQGLTGAEIVYFVLNDYWFDAKQTRIRAEAETQELIHIGDGKITIFKYYNEK